MGPSNVKVTQWTVYILDREVILFLFVFSWEHGNSGKKDGDLGVSGVHVHHFNGSSSSPRVGGTRKWSHSLFKNSVSLKSQNGLHVDDD